MDEEKNEATVALDPEVTALGEILENGSMEERLGAVRAIEEAHNIQCYTLLRKAAKNDPEQAVRDAVRAAERKLEDEFGEDNCLAEQERVGGSYVDNSMNSFEAAATGNAYSASLSAFR